MDTTALEGRWKQVSAVNFEQYMEAVGVPAFIRMLAANIQVTVVIHVEGDKFFCKQESPFKTTELNFTLGEEFDETTPDGRQFRTICTVTDGKLVQRQKAVNEGDKNSEITRFLENGRLITVMRCGEVECRREYEKE